MNLARPVIPILSKAAVYVTIYSNKISCAYLFEDKKKSCRTILCHGYHGRHF